MVIAVRGLGSEEFAAARERVALRLHQHVPPHAGVYGLVAYHLGWRDECGRALDGTSGKLLRPMLCLLVAESFGDAHPAAVDAACAIELLHAFSLVHDDIEDGDRERRGRPTLWALEGVPLAINAGDSLFALAHRAMNDAAGALREADAAEARRIFSDACLRMIEGQHDDLSMEAQTVASLAEYEAMAVRKTGALLGASLAIGGLFGGAPPADVEALRQAGAEMGLAFQAVDDALAIWGDARATGKPAKNDLERGKKSLPVVIAREVGVSPDDARVRARCDDYARAHADNARRLIRGTGLSASGIARLDTMINFVIERES
ncbi:MAG TPA: polyprenyl synthetase family protein [Dehalococcoidia bacterium]|nr:polyprenyl synthetase family protein [Dehalococcoidia bacterium]